MLVIIDNYDSFTYNIVQTVAANGLEEGRTEDIRVFRNDKITIREIEELQPDRLMISPGPGTPDEAGICLRLVKALGPTIPIFGVCLGHQCIGQAFGARVVRAERIMHGKTSMIYHRSQGVFAGLDQPFQATRYHSLTLDPESVPDTLSVMAWTEYKGGHEIMGIKHKQFNVQGVQFHPESILTTSGHALLKNFLQSISLKYL